MNFVFCIDASGSMRGNRESQVKSAICKVIQAAKGVAELDPKAKLWMASTGFNERDFEICEPTRISASEESLPMRRLLEKVMSYESNGNTSIVAGLNSAMKQIASMGRLWRNPSARSVIILLSDGEDSRTRQEAASIRNRLISKNIEIFSIGISKGHDKTTLLSISGDENYIDTTEGTSIEEAIQVVYEKALATFREVRVEIVGLPETSEVEWRVGEENSEEKLLSIGSLSETDDPKDICMEIKTSSLQELVNLKRIKFLLSYIDPRGRQGKSFIPWNPNGVMDPQVLRA